MIDAKKDEQIKKKLDELALSLATHATLETTIFVDKLDAFKALTAYHLGVSKVNKKKSGEDNNPEKGETFDGFRKSVETSG